MGLSPLGSFSLVSSLHIWLPHGNTITIVIPLVVIIIGPAIKTSIPALLGIISINSYHNPRHRYYTRFAGKRMDSERVGRCLRSQDSWEPSHKPTVPAPKST